MKPRLGMPLLLCAVLSGCADETPPATVPQAEQSPTLEVSVTAVREGAGGARWRSAFDVRLDSQALMVEVRIQAVAGPGLSTVHLGEAIARWRREVQGFWNDRFHWQTGATSVPICLRVVFTPRRPHYRVVVHADAGRPVDQLNWTRWTPSAVVAHEVGHMLGAWDEYSGPGQDPRTPRVDPGGLMGADADAATPPRPRHLSFLRRSLLERGAHGRVIEHGGTALGSI